MCEMNDNNMNVCVNFSRCDRDSCGSPRGLLRRGVATPARRPGAIPHDRAGVTVLPAALPAAAGSPHHTPTAMTSQSVPLFISTFAITKI